MISEGQMMAALYERLTEQTTAVALFGEPAAVQQTPLLYLLSNQSDYAPHTRTTDAATISPRIRIVVAWQQPPAAETQLLTLVDEIVSLVTDAPIADACKGYVRQILYGYLTVGGTRYRMAQLALHIEQDEL
jgi:hypothetical protein